MTVAGGIVADQVAPTPLQAALNACHHHGVALNSRYLLPLHLAQPDLENGR
jgi:hypothetical protein